MCVKRFLFFCLQIAVHAWGLQDATRMSMTVVCVYAGACLGAVGTQSSNGCEESLFDNSFICFFFFSIFLNPKDD